MLKYTHAKNKVGCSHELVQEMIFNIALKKIQTTERKIDNWSLWVCQISLWKIPLGKWNIKPQTGKNIPDKMYSSKNIFDKRSYPEYKHCCLTVRER